MRRRFLLAGLVALTAAIVACSTPPDKERQQADAAIAAARAADATTYAAAELTAAQSALDWYAAAVAQHDYRQALNLALEARDTGYEAAKKATEEKNAVRGQAEQLLSDLETLSRTANARVSGAAAQKASSASANRLRVALRSSTSALQEARTRVGRQDYRGAVTTLTPAIESLRKLLEPPSAPAGRRGK